MNNHWQGYNLRKMLLKPSRIDTDRTVSTKHDDILTASFLFKRGLR
jgi:hypothetical protein